MQKLPEALIGSMGKARVKKEKELLLQKKESHSLFSSGRRRVYTSISLAANGKPRDRFKAAPWLTFH